MRTLNDSGNYTVRVANSNGAVNSSPAVVQVYPPIVIVMSPTGTNVDKGGKITLAYGRFEITVPAGTVGSGFIRTVRRPN